ncbi:MAG: transcriptional regulator, partial [Candidatus Bathyarchaeota archaeon]|nr:transcriptional regulator [Candidatus Bathyarchaeota archaeon]
MSSLEKPSSLTMRRIYFALVQKPRSFQDLVKVTKVDKTTLEIALIFLKEQGMVISYNFNNWKKIRMVRTQP